MTVLLDQVADDLGLLARHPASKRHEQELEMDYLDHVRRLSDYESARVTHSIQAYSSFRTERDSHREYVPIESPMNCTVIALSEVHEWPAKSRVTTPPDTWVTAMSVIAPQAPVPTME